ncbi:MAG TPA: EamA family transporter, partial [Chloroflexi bacterium]|nr:EamA family transporter [Chloroflexota bacterium]
MNSTEKNINLPGLLNLFVVYIVWGSTYLAIRVAVQEDGGFAPFILGFSRVIVAGTLLILWGVLRKERLKPNRQETITLVVSGLTLWVGGNGLVSWAEQRANSGLAALIIAATPIWVAIVEAMIDRKLPTLRMTAALLIGFGGIAVLTTPTLRQGVRADIISIVAILLAGLSWGIGSVVQSRRPVALTSVVSAGYQQLIGAIGFGFVILLLGETWSMPSPGVWLAWGYLVIFGSLFAFTAFIRALNLLPTKIVMTYPYVNPVIAVFLGWLILKEAVTPWTLAGAALVLLGVAGVFYERARLERAH